MKDHKNKEAQGKVIQFPGVTAERATLVAEEKALRTSNMKKPIMALASTVLIATVVNYFVPQTSKTASEQMAMNSHGVQTRSLASLGDAGRTLRDPNFEKNLAQKLSKLSSRDIASVGRVPTYEDRLRFGYLEGKYALRMNDGKLSEIEFSQGPDAPKYLNDRAEFLTTYKDLMPVEFESTKSISREILPKMIHETYQLVSNDKVTAEVRFELDLYGRLISMKVESLARN